MKRRFSIMLGLILAFTLMLALVAFAADNTVVYIKDGGTGDGSSPEEATSTLTAAHSYLDLSQDCTVVVCGPYTQKVTWVWKGGNYDGSVTYTSVYDGVDYRKTAGAVYQFNAARFVCFGETKFENMDFVALGTNLLVVGQFNPITVGEGVTMTGSQMKGGNISTAFCLLGGYQSGQSSPPTSGTEEANITVLSGSKMYIVPFSRSINGDFTGTANIKIGGNANVSVLHLSAAGPAGVTTGDVNVEITDNAYIDVVYGVTSVTKVGAIDITWKSGTINDFQWVCKYTPAATIEHLKETSLNVTPKAKAQDNYNIIAANFDKVTDIKDDPTLIKDKLSNQTVIYVKDGGNGNGASADKALGSLDDAFDSLDLTKDCTIVICGPYTQNGTFNYEKPYTGSVTYTSVYGGTDYRTTGAVYQFAAVRFICNGATKFENIKFSATGNYFLVVGNFNPVTVGEGVVVDAPKFTGTSIAKSFAIIGGYQDNVNDPLIADDRDTNITVLSGSKIYIIPFTREMLGDFMGTANIKIGGTAEIGVLHGSSAYPDGIKVGKVKIEIADNAKIANFYGCTQVTTADSYEFIWNGGDITNFQWNCSSTPAAYLTVMNGTVLRASDAVKAKANYATIAANFDKVVGLTEAVTFGNRLVSPTVTSDYAAARGLFLAGLAQGYDTTGTNFGLEDNLTRVQTVVQVIRFLGVEDEVKAGNFPHPFTDVPAWANNYVGYAYANNITSGRSATKFDPDGVVDEMQFLTFMLRAIGYSDKDGDFVWNDPFAFAYRVGLSNAQIEHRTFNRGDAFRTSWRAIFATAKNKKAVYDNLIADGVFTMDTLKAAMTEADTVAAPAKTSSAVIENGYYVISVEDYKDKTMAGFMAQFTGFLSGYEFARNSDGSPKIAMPDSWFDLCNGPYAAHNPNNVHGDKLLLNEETGIWEVWNDDDFSIDILNQYILKNTYAQYGTVTSKAITDGWVKYNVYDMGGGHRRQGAYGLMSKYGYLPIYTGNKEFGGLYNVNGEPYIANETLGMSAAAMPSLAIDQAELFGGATSDRDPIRWLKFFTALISMAYVEDDIPTMMREAQKILPEDSWQYQCIDEAFRLHEEFPDDWRRAVAHIERNNRQKHYDLDNYNGETSVNCSMILVGLLYGEGDFYETCKIISLAGHGGDSTTPVGLSAVAIACGWEGIDAKTRATVNEKVWKDGKGVVVNRPINDDQDTWMYMAALPERIYMADTLQMFQDNFESNLIANGGKIENGNYYIPVTKLGEVEQIFVDEFEHASLDGYKTSGTVEISDGFSGEYGVKVSGATAESALTKTLTGLTVGEDYRVTAFISTAAGATANLSVMSGDESVLVTVYNETIYGKREFVFTAGATTAELKFYVPAGTPSHRYGIIDEIWVLHADEKSEGTAAIAAPTANNAYTGRFDINVASNENKEVILKLTFANKNAEILNTTVRVNGSYYAGVPFYKTGDNGMGIAYIPVIAKDATNYTVNIDTGSKTLYIYGAELVTVSERW